VKKIAVDTYEDMSQLMASILLGEMVKDKRSNISITGGSTPIRTFEIMIEKYKTMKEVFSDTYFYNFDNAEIGEDKKSTTNTLLNNQFYGPAGVDSKNIKLLTMNNYDQYDQMIKEDGGLDIMMIGLGLNGHFCGNEPYSTDFSKGTHRVKIDKKYPWYSVWEDICPDGNIPEYYVTMGFKSLLKVKHLVLIVNGRAKAEVVKKMLSLDITNEFPSTALLLHPNLTIILDKEAASKL